MNRQRAFAITVLRGNSTKELEQQIDSYQSQGWKTYYPRWLDSWNRPHQAMVSYTKENTNENCSTQSQGTRVGA